MLVVLDTIILLLFLIYIRYEKELVKQENEQRINVKMLEHAYSMYYKTFLELRQQLIFIVFLEEYYK